MSPATFLTFRPYARLLTMLGDQLIKNERIALVEVIKNAYDADASWVRITFENFTPDFETTPTSRIVIEDDGSGMTPEIIKEHWVNPATPVKLIGKKTKATTPQGRVIQGEKGIGRFALLKLGQVVEVTTRARQQAFESTLTMDLSGYDENFITDEGALFLDQLQLKLVRVKPPCSIAKGKVSFGSREVRRRDHGTRICVSHLCGTWSRTKVEAVYDDVARLQSIFELNQEGAAARKATFEVVIYRDENYEPFSTVRRQKLATLLERHAPVRVENGVYDQAKKSFSLEINDKHQEISLLDPAITGLTVFRKNFGKQGEKLKQRGTHCGSFSFSFYMFDFGPDAKGQYLLDKDDKDLIKEHRVYLYRDGIRVYPYGDKEDDWLGIDVYRGTIRASEFVSNEQTVGYVNITQAHNPNLKDKTSREGLIDTGYATEDFKAVLQTLLAWLRKGPFEQYLRKVRTARDVEVFKKQKVLDAFEKLEKATTAHPELVEPVQEALQLYKQERQYLVQRAEITEHLAGVGLSVETASHDLMLAMQRVLTLVHGMLAQAEHGPLHQEALRRDLTTVSGSLSFIESQMKNLQLLFKSTKQRRKDIPVIDMVEKVERLYKGPLARAGIQVKFERTTQPLVAKSTDAVLLQLLLNLFDNALYWLEGRDGQREILIRLDGDQQTMTFADNGPGFRAEDRDYAFDPFFSGKGEEGRGLGLYIARQLLERHGFEIHIADRREAILPGANLVVNFVPES